jgi:lysozyme
MRRSEKLGMLTGLIVGTILLLISFLMGVKPACKVWGSQTALSASEAEKKGIENSFRYKNGKLIVDSTKTAARTTTSINVKRPENASAQGIDVSYHQGVINWEKVKNTGKVDFAIIRCGYGMNEWNETTQTWTQDDPQWEYNTSECERLNIPYGVYLYSYADTTEKAKSEAEHVIRMLEGKNLSYPIYYDMEDKSVMNNSKITATKASQIAQTFLNTMKAAGYNNLGVYSSKYYFETKLTASVFNQYPKWVAQYSNSCTYKKNYQIWQCSNSTVKISVQWKSSNTKIATVDKNGKITAKSAGKVYITATLNSSAKAICKVTVTPKPTKIKSVKKSGKNGIKITWNKVSGISNYQIYMSTKSKSGFKKIATVSASKTSYTKTKLKKCKRYYFKIRTAKKVSGAYYYSSYTAVKSVKR